MKPEVTNATKARAWESAPAEKKALWLPPRQALTHIDLHDGTIVAMTYANYRKEAVGTSIVSVRFKMSEVDAMAKEGK